MHCDLLQLVHNGTKFTQSKTKETDCNRPGSVINYYNRKLLTVVVYLEQYKFDVARNMMSVKLLTIPF